jgi:hypothetical protein
MAHPSGFHQGKKERRRTLNYFQPRRSISQHCLPSAKSPVHLDVQVALLAMAQKLNPGKWLDIGAHYRFG